MLSTDKIFNGFLLIFPDQLIKIFNKAINKNNESTFVTLWNWCLKITQRYIIYRKDYTPVQNQKFKIQKHTFSFYY